MKLFKVVVVLTIMLCTCCRSKETTQTESSAPDSTEALKELVAHLKDRTVGDSIRNANDRVAAELAALGTMIEFSGTYEIGYKGYTGDDLERFELSVTGSAVWTHKTKSGSSTKYGTWTVGDDTISVSIKGNTGIITEDFARNGAKHVSTDDENRYLEKLK